MRVFGYAKTFNITDTQAKALGITLETPFICLWQDQNNHILLTNAFLHVKNPKEFDYASATMTKTGWRVKLTLPFPWEQEYRFIKIKQGVFQLTNKTIRTKEAIDGKPITPLPNRGRQKAPKLQNLRNPKPTTHGQDPDITDTLI